MTRTGLVIALWFVLIAMVAPMAVALMAGPAQSQSANCGPHDIVVARLATGYGEVRQALALGANNSVLEIFASDVSGTWTITVTTPDGPTCLVASGQSYQAVTEPLPPPGEDS